MSVVGKYSGVRVRTTSVGIAIEVFCGGGRPGQVSLLLGSVVVLWSTHRGWVGTSGLHGTEP